MNDETIMEDIKKFDKNVILYGPPGTGKTYNAIKCAVAICDGGFNKDTYLDRYKSLVKEGRIAFTTFHQSYGYEEFVEGISPVIEKQGDGSNVNMHYSIKDGVFKKFCKKAEALNLEVRESKTSEQIENVWKIKLEDEKNEVMEDCFKKNLIKVGEIVEPGLKSFKEDIKIKDVVLAFNDEKVKRVGVVDSYCYINPNDKYKYIRNVIWRTGDIDEEIIRFCDVDINKKDIVMKIDKEHLKDDFYETLKKKFEKPPCVFIIDEINRGNISKIFGELITLIEPSKRVGEDEELSAILPYSGDKFGVPSNVYIIGTMNTADRSIALMDTALRRRFQFEEIGPDDKALGNIKVEGINICKMLEIINKRIEVLYDREHMIGHSFFINLKNSTVEDQIVKNPTVKNPTVKNPTVKDLGEIFKKSIIPLLQEYFYDDYEKIKLVLGKKGTNECIFITDNKVNEIFSGNIDELNLPENIYKINEAAFNEAQNYIDIDPEKISEKK